MKLLFIGAQGSGKGTQAKIISEKLNILHISTGDLLRSSEGELKKELDTYMNSGKLVPDELILKILKERLEKEDAKKGFILDGFPRNLKQAEMLKNITEIDYSILIDISDEEAVKRISGRVSCENCKEGYNELTQPKPQQQGICDKCQGKLVKRADDTEEAVRKRLSIYHQETEPVLKLYEEKNKLIKINGEQDIENITKDILNEINR